MVDGSYDKGFIVYIDIKPQLSLGGKLDNLVQKEFNELLVEEAKKKNLLEGF